MRLCDWGCGIAMYGRRIKGWGPHVLLLLHRTRGWVSKTDICKVGRLWTGSIKNPNFNRSTVLVKEAYHSERSCAVLVTNP